MKAPSQYVSRMPDTTGVVRYTEDENRIWAELHERQRRVIRDRACPEFVHGLELLRLPADRVPQLPEISRVLRRETGWEVAYVPALIPFEEFFRLLSERKFPAATFVRRRDELNYLQEPDIFHELFGHTPLLTNPYFAEFTQTYGKLGLAASAEDRVFLARMFWFTVEFGLVGSLKGAAEGSVRIYGGGILSSIGETEYALAEPARMRRFDIVDVLRTPYRIDIMQPLYFVIEDLRELYELTKMDLSAQIREARRLGLHAPLFQSEEQAA